MNKLHQEAREYLPQLRVGSGRSKFNPNPSYNLPRLIIGDVDPYVTSFFNNKFGACAIYAGNDADNPLLTLTAHLIFPIKPERMREFGGAIKEFGYTVEYVGGQQWINCLSGQQELIHVFSVGSQGQNVVYVGHNHNVGVPSHVLYVARLDTDQRHGRLLDEVADLLDMPNARSEIVEIPKTSSDPHKTLAEVDVLLRQLEEPIKVV